MLGICRTFLFWGKHLRQWIWLVGSGTGTRFGQNQICWCGWAAASVSGCWTPEAVPGPDLRVGLLTLHQLLGLCLASESKFGAGGTLTSNVRKSSIPKLISPPIAGG